MTENGNGQEVVKVMLKDGKITVTFGDANLAIISHALRLASLEVDNVIIGNQQPKSNLTVPKTVIDKMRRGMKL